MGWWFRYSGTDECTGLCRNNDACEWVGYRKYDKYCEFWTSGSCQNPHDQSGHDIYHVTTSTTTTTTPAATTTTAAAATAEPTMSANKWCNGDKTFVSGMESKVYSGTDECIGLCRNNAACDG